jgi:molybdenum cofactor cytidylyltransferase
MEVQPDQIAAVVLAAGMSTRMGRPKMTLPWGDTTVIGQVIQVITLAGLDPIMIVTGAARQAVGQALSGFKVQFVDNPAYQTGEMLSSIQAGLAALAPTIRAAMIFLGDQPQVQPGVIRAICDDYGRSHNGIHIPSYQGRRGHPLLIDSALWPAIGELQHPATLRDFINSRPQRIAYTDISTDSILRDLDTPEDYQAGRPGRP